jgi:hypothetical protein
MAAAHNPSGAHWAAQARIRLDGVHDSVGDAILKSKEFPDLALEAIGPELEPGRRISELGSNSQALTLASDVAAEDVAGRTLGQVAGASFGRKLRCPRCLLLG